VDNAKVEPTFVARGGAARAGTGAAISNRIPGKGCRTRPSRLPIPVRAEATSVAA
jgi:hypothetical protein